MIYNSESAPDCSVNIDPLLVNITNTSDQKFKGDETEDSGWIYNLILLAPCNDWEMMFIVRVFRCEWQPRHCKIKNKLLPYYNGFYFYSGYMLYDQTLHSGFKHHSRISEIQQNCKTKGLGYPPPVVYKLSETASPWKINLWICACTAL